MPDAGWAVSRHLPTLARGIEVQIPVSTSFEYVTTRHQRFTHVRLLKTHLTEYSPPFPATLTTGALYPRSLWWFEACPCRPTSGGRPPSPVKHRSSQTETKRSQHTTSSYLTDRHSRSTNTLSRHEPRPAMLILIACSNSRPVNAELVN